MTAPPDRIWALLPAPGATSGSYRTTRPPDHWRPECAEYLCAINGEWVHANDHTAAIAALEAENADLKTSVVAFCAPWAATYAKTFGLPDGHLHPTHFDILAKAGARMDDFTRADLEAGQ